MFMIVRLNWLKWTPTGLSNLAGTVGIVASVDSLLVCSSGTQNVLALFDLFISN